MAGIFISYRRDDSRGFAGRLSDDLSALLGPDRVFRDIEIPVGSDFGDVLHRAIRVSDALLVVMGRHWADQSNQGCGARLFEPTDWVRTEIEAAFDQGKLLVPVLVGGADMPKAASLPESIQPLTRLQAAVLTDRHWEKDIAALAQRLRVLCPSLLQAQPKVGSTEDTPADVLRELGERLLDLMEARPQPQLERPKTQRSFARRFGRRVRSWILTAIVITLIYAGFRLFGDDNTLRQLDQLEAQLAVGWERLLLYIERM